MKILSYDSFACLNWIFPSRINILREVSPQANNFSGRYEGVVSAPP